MTSKRAVRERNTWDDQAQDYHDVQQEKYQFLFDWAIARTNTNLTKDQRVIEIGCGSGLVTFGIASSVRQIKAYDISEEMLVVARSEAKKQSVDNVEFLQGDAYNLPEPDACYDVALLFYVLDIVEQPEVVLKEAHRVLKDGGTLISVTDCYQDIETVSPLRHVLREVKWNVEYAMRKAKLGIKAKDTLRDSELFRMTSDAGFRALESEVFDTGEGNQYNLYLNALKV